MFRVTIECNSFSHSFLIVNLLALKIGQPLIIHCNVMRCFQDVEGFNLKKDQITFCHDELNNINLGTLREITSIVGIIVKCRIDFGLDERTCF